MKESGLSGKRTISKVLGFILALFAIACGDNGGQNPLSPSAAPTVNPPTHFSGGTGGGGESDDDGHLANDGDENNDDGNSVSFGDNGTGARLCQNRKNQVSCLVLRYDDINGATVEVTNLGDAGEYVNAHVYKCLDSTCTFTLQEFYPEGSQRSFLRPGESAVLTMTTPGPGCISQMDVYLGGVIQRPPHPSNVLLGFENAGQEVCVPPGPTPQPRPQPEPEPEPRPEPRPRPEPEPEPNPEPNPEPEPEPEPGVCELTFGYNNQEISVENGGSVTWFVQENVSSHLVLAEKFDGLSGTHWTSNDEYKLIVVKSARIYAMTSEVRSGQVIESPSRNHRGILQDISNVSAYICIE